MITVARIIEAWRDAQIFKNSTAPRGFWWHAFKYPQYGLWVLSGLVPFIGFYFWPGFESTLVFSLWHTTFVIVIDIVFAYFAFEYFLNKFRE